MADETKKDALVTNLIIERVTNSNYLQFFFLIYSLGMYLILTSIKAKLPANATAVGSGLASSQRLPSVEFRSVFQQFSNVFPENISALDSIRGGNTVSN